MKCSHFCAALVVIAAIPFVAISGGKKERVLWLETQEAGSMKTAMAVSVELARYVLENSENKQESLFEKDVISREMVEDVLDGKRESVEVKEDSTDRIYKLFLGTLKVPSAYGEGNQELVVETYKKGRRTFSLRLPYARESEPSNRDEEDVTRITFGWNSVLPFMAKTNGLVYVRDVREDTEFWMFVD